MSFDKDPGSLSLLTWAWVLGLSCLGGAVRYLRKVRSGAPFSIAWMAVSMLTSAFAGILTYLLCDAANFVGPLAAALVGISGWMGTEALNGLEDVWRRKIGVGHAPYQPDHRSGGSRVAAPGRSSEQAD